MAEIRSIGIDLYHGPDHNRQGLQFDVGDIISRLKEEFPGIWFREEYYQQQLERIRELEADQRISKKDAEELGPKFTFAVSGEDHAIMRGFIGRYRLSFHILDVTPPPLQQRAEEFLNSFRLTRSNNGGGS